MVTLRAFGIGVRRRPSNMLDHLSDIMVFPANNTVMEGIVVVKTV